MDLRTAARKAYRSTTLYKLRKLFEEESRWLRKATIARNKLAAVRKKINATAEALAKEKAGVVDAPKNVTP